MKFNQAIWVVAASLAGGSAWADDLNTVAVSGEAPLINGDKDACKKEAMRQARRNAIEKGAGVLVESNSIMKNYELINDEISTSAKGVILDEKFGELATGATGNSCSITLSAKVSREAVSDAICSVVKANHDPKVSLVFVEKVGDESKWSTERGLVEAMFTDAFINNCFTIVESGIKVTEVSATGDLPQSAIAEIVKNSDAQYVVLGSGKFIKSTQAKDSILGSSGMNSYSVSASLKMINTANNEIEAVATDQVQVLGISPEVALKAKSKNGDLKAGTMVEKIMDVLMKKIGARWTSDMVNSSNVSVVIQNVANFAAAKAFKELAEKTMVGAKVEQRKVSGGTASFDVKVDGGSEALAAAVEGKKAGKFTVEVIEVTKGKVVLKLN